MFDITSTDTGNMIFNDILISIFDDGASDGNRDRIIDDRIFDCASISKRERIFDSIFNIIFDGASISKGEGIFDSVLNGIFDGTLVGKGDGISDDVSNSTLDAVSAGKGDG